MSKRPRAAPERFLGARSGPTFPPPPTDKWPQIDDQNETNSLIKEQRALRQPPERCRPAPNVRVMGDDVYTGENGKKQHSLLILVPTTHIPHTPFGTHLEWVTKLSRINKVDKHFTPVSSCFQVISAVPCCFHLFPLVFTCFLSFSLVSSCFHQIPLVFTCFLLFPAVSFCFHLF